MTVYHLAGLQIISDFSLSGLEICPDEIFARDEIVVRRAPISDEMISATATLRLRQQHTGKYNGRDVLLDFPAVGRFFVRGGKEILVDPNPASNNEEIRAYLLSIVFGVLCHQRGIVPLHASAIGMAEGCVAFAGDSGSGKSTLVAALALRGHEVISDDLCFLDIGHNGHLKTWPSVGCIRLWEEAMHELGYDARGFEREIRGYEKYVIPVRRPRNPFECRRLCRVYVLHAAVEDTEVIPLHGTAAVEALMQNVYPLSFSEILGYRPQAFMACAAAAREMSVFRYSRPLSFDALDQSVELLEEHLRGKDYIC
jgi:hypothetical protein